MSSRPAAWTDTDSTEGEIEIVMDNHQIRDGDREVAEELFYSHAAVVHIGLGFDQQDFFPVGPPVTNQRVVFYLLNCDLIFRGDPVDNQKTQVVPAPFIFLAWITQTENDFHG